MGENKYTQLVQSEKKLHLIEHRVRKPRHTQINDTLRLQYVRIKDLGVLPCTSSSMDVSHLGYPISSYEMSTEPISSLSMVGSHLAQTIEDSKL